MKHCDRCDDTGVVYKLARGGRYYDRFPCPVCCHIGLNANEFYIDERAEQLAINLTPETKVHSVFKPEMVLHVDMGRGSSKSVISGIIKKLEGGE